MSVYQALLDLVGPVPAGYEALAWTAAAVFLLYLIVSVFSILSSVIHFAGGK